MRSCNSLDGPVDLFAVRRENLKRLVLFAHGGNKAAFARAAGVHPNHINLLLTDNETHRRNLGESLARKIEEGLGLRRNQLDERDGQDLAAVRITSADVSPALSSVLRRSDLLQCIQAREWALRTVDSHIESLTELSLAEVATAEMAPELTVGDCVLLQMGVGEVSVDGIYALAKGDQVFLRRVQRQLSGGLLVSTGLIMGQQVHLDDLSGFKVLARIPIALGMRRL